MRAYLGLDTSNYTTSAALYDAEQGVMLSEKKLIPVKEGELGARQSDAVFHHVKQLPALISSLTEGFAGEIVAVGASSTPRPIEGSYMPCFEVGVSCASQLASCLRRPLFLTSHQEGHIAAALYSAECFDSIGDRFIAFHVSGGTTEAVLASRTAHGFELKRVCGSLDLKGGQLIDRIAKALGLAFPGGKELERLALSWREPVKVKATLKGLDCCLSGAENKCRELIGKGEPKERVARICLEYVRVSLEKMTEGLLAAYGKLPLLYAGGVMSNTIIRKSFEEEFGACFAAPEYSCDNACGVAFLTSRAFC